MFLKLIKYRNGAPVVSRCLKNLLFLANFLAWLVGVFMLGVGCYAKVDKSYFSEVSSLVLDPVTPILIIGGLIFFVTFFGCVGALRENVCMLKFFSFALLAAFMSELLTAFTSVALSDSARSTIEDLMLRTIKQYRDDPDLQNIIDWGQEEFKCCGVYGVNDWTKNPYFNCSDDNPSREKCGVPYSCCSPPDGDIINTFCGMDVQRMDAIDRREIVNTAGCIDAFALWLHENIFFFALLTLLLCCVPQILGILISRVLIIQIKDQDFYIKIGLLNSRGEFEMNWL